MITEILIYGLVTSAIYAMLAVGLTLIVGIAKVFNVAHGAFYMLGAYVIFTLTIRLKIPLGISFIVSLLVVAFIGIIVYIVCLRPLKGSLEGTLLVSLIVALFFEEVIQLAFGPKPQAIPPFMTGRFLLGGVSVPSQRILVLIVSVATLSSLWIFISKTKVGGAILAVSQDPEAASLVGIHTNRIILVVNGLAAFLAALAGMLVSPLLSSTPIMWILPFVKAFVIVILGGLGSIAGSIIAAVIVGYTETIVSFALSPRFTELITLGFLFLVIVVRPSGIMGTKMQR